MRQAADHRIAIVRQLHSLPQVFTSSKSLPWMIRGLNTRPISERWRMRAALLSITRDQAGVTAIEYALIAGLISLMIVAGVTRIGTTLSGFFNTVATSF